MGLFINPKKGELVETFPFKSTPFSEDIDLMDYHISTLRFTPDQRKRALDVLRERHPEISDWKEAENTLSPGNIYGAFTESLRRERGLVPSGNANVRNKLLAKRRETAQEYANRVNRWGQAKTRKLFELATSGDLEKKGFLKVSTFGPEEIKLMTKDAAIKQKLKAQGVEMPTFEEMVSPYQDED